MTEPTDAQPISLKLSTEQVLVVLNALGVATIPGIGAEEWMNLSPDQQDVALRVARRDLAARDLLQMGADGEVRLHRTLLAAVGVCAYAERTALIEHWAAGASGSTRMTAYTRGDDSVVHTVDQGIHTFAVLPSDAALVEHLAAELEWDGAPATPALELTVSRKDFTRACNASADGSEMDALRALTSATVPFEAGAALVHALAGGPRISIVQAFRSSPVGLEEESSFTVVDGGGRAWLVAPTTREPDAPLKARTASRAEIGSAMVHGA